MFTAAAQVAAVERRVTAYSEAGQGTDTVERVGRFCRYDVEVCRAWLAARPTRIRRGRRLNGGTLNVPISAGVELHMSGPAARRRPAARREREHVAPRGRAPRVDGPGRTRRPSGAAAASARRSPLQETSAMTTGPKPPPAGRVWCTRCGARPGVMRQLGEVLCRLCADSPDGDAAARRSQKS